MLISLSPDSFRGHLKFPTGPQIFQVFGEMGNFDLYQRGPFAWSEDLGLVFFWSSWENIAIVYENQSE